MKNVIYLLAFYVFLSFSACKSGFIKTSSNTKTDIGHFGGMILDYTYLLTGEFCTDIYIIKIDSIYQSQPYQSVSSHIISNYTDNNIHSKKHFIISADPLCYSPSFIQGNEYIIYDKEHYIKKDTLLLSSLNKNIRILGIDAYSKDSLFNPYISGGMENILNFHYGKKLDSTNVKQLSKQEFPLIYKTIKDLYTSKNTCVRVYYANKQLRFKGEIKNGLRSGKWVYYLSNGHLFYEHY